MKKILKNGNLLRVAYPVLVIGLIVAAAYVFASPLTKVEAQKFERKQSTGTERLATATFPTSTTLPLPIPDNSSAGTSLSIPVSGLTDEVRGVALNITFDQPAGGGGHTWVGDLNVVLSSPAPSNVHTIFSRTGSSTGTGAGDSSDAQGPYTFTDGTTGDWWATAVSTIGGTIPAGLYRTHANGSATPTDMNPVFQGPALADPRAGFEKSGGNTKTIQVNPSDNLGNGTWTLAISDNAGGDTGRVAAASLTVTTLAPTAALAGIRGDVRTASGRPISRAFVTILNTDTNETFVVQTNHFGHFNFEDLPVGVFYTMWVEHGRYQFENPMQSFTLDGDIGAAEFIAN